MNIIFINFFQITLKARLRLKMSNVTQQNVENLNAEHCVVAVTVEVNYSSYFISMFDALLSL